MNPILSPYVLIMIIAAIVCMFIAVYVWPQRRKNSETIPLILLLVAITEWIAAALLGMLDQNLAHKILWAKIEYIGVDSVPLLLLVYVLHHSGSYQRLTWKWLAWLAAIPAITLLLAWTNEYHGLIWARYIPYLQNGLAFSEKIYGPVFWIYWGYSYLLLLAATIIIFRSMLASARTVPLAEPPGRDRDPGALGRQSPLYIAYQSRQEFGPDPAGLWHYRHRAGNRHVPVAAVRYQAHRAGCRDRRHGGWVDDP